METTATAAMHRIFLIIIIISSFNFHFQCDAQNDMDNAGTGDIEAGCYPGSYLFNRRCYYISNWATTFDNAETACAVGGGKLVEDRDDEVHLTIRRLQRKILFSYWIGLNNRDNENIWVYGDGTRVEINVWAPGEPNNLGGDQRCGLMFSLLSLFWDDEICSRKHYYICQFEGSKCDSRPNEKLGDVCFEISQEIATYDDAQTSCHSKGGFLVNVKTKSIHYFLKKLIKNANRWKTIDNPEIENFLRNNDEVPSVWIGIRRYKGKWVYNYGNETATYDKWASGQPNAQADNRCVAMKELWQNVACNTPQYYICEYKPSVDLATMQIIEDVFPVDKMSEESKSTAKDDKTSKTTTSDVTVGVNHLAVLLFVFFVLGTLAPLCVWSIVIRFPQIKQRIFPNSNYERDLSIMQHDEMSQDYNRAK